MVADIIQDLNVVLGGFLVLKSDDIKQSFTELSEDYNETPTINTKHKIHSMDVLYERQTILKKLDQIMLLLSHKMLSRS